jgi:Na+-driven multidrug efflux pump
MMTYLLINLPHLVGVAMVGYLNNKNALAAVALGTLVSVPAAPLSSWVII